MSAKASDSDEELTMFDLLVKDSLTKEEIKQVKNWYRQCL